MYIYTYMIYSIHMRRNLILKRALIRQCYKFTTCRLLRANVICHFVVGAGGGNCRPVRRRSVVEFSVIYYST